jgi:hypothetical protein
MPSKRLVALRSISLDFRPPLHPSLVRSNAFGLGRHCVPFLRQLFVDFLRTEIADLLRDLFALPRSIVHFFWRHCH